MTQIEKLLALSGLKLGQQEKVSQNKDCYEVFNLIPDELNQILSYLLGIGFQEKTDQFIPDFWFVTQFGYGDGALSNLVFGVHGQDSNTSNRLADTYAVINQILGREAD